MDVQPIEQLVTHMDVRSTRGLVDQLVVQTLASSQHNSVGAISLPVMLATIGAASGSSKSTAAMADASTTVAGIAIATNDGGRLGSATGAGLARALPELVQSQLAGGFRGRGFATALRGRSHVVAGVFGLGDAGTCCRDLPFRSGFDDGQQFLLQGRRLASARRFRRPATGAGTCSIVSMTDAGDGMDAKYIHQTHPSWMRCKIDGHGKAGLSDAKPNRTLFARHVGLLPDHARDQPNLRAGTNGKEQRRWKTRRFLRLTLRAAQPART